MHTTTLARSLALAFGAAAASAQAVNLSPNGMGQVLIYPYYTVQAGQQTLLSVVNNSDIGKATKVRFLEAYNGRTVLEFTVFLSPRDIWTAVVFKLSDAGVADASGGAAIFTTDQSCMAPKLPEGPLSNGATYQHFLNYGFTGSTSDTGPTTDARTAEGHFEVIAMADIQAGSALAQDITHVDGVPPGCSKAEADFETGTGTVAPTTGLFGAASIVNVPEGTFYAYNAQALDGFTAVKLNAPLATGEPNLASVNDPGGTTATARQFVAGGTVITSVFPAARAIDAVSAVFAADAVYNEFVTGNDNSIVTDWVLTFPTKRYYVDPALTQTALAPFEHLFGARESGNDGGASCTAVGYTLFDRDERASGVTGNYCGFNECPPTSFAASLCAETNVMQFGPNGALGTHLGTPPQNYPVTYSPFPQGMLKLDLNPSDNSHTMTASNNGNVFHGLPVTGFAATKYVNGSVALSGGGSALANYSATYPHRPTTNCTSTTANGPCS